MARKGKKPEKQSVPISESGRKCGECLFRNTEVVTLGADGKCPKCGTDYGHEQKP